MDLLSIDSPIGLAFFNTFDAPAACLSVAVGKFKHLVWLCFSLLSFVINAAVINY